MDGISATSTYWDLYEYGGWGWGVYQVSAGTVNIIPHSDTHNHTFGLACACDPFYREGELIHRAWDGREMYEMGVRLVH